MIVICAAVPLHARNMQPCGVLCNILCAWCGPREFSNARAGEAGIESWWANWGGAYWGWGRPGLGEASALDATVRKNRVETWKDC